MEKTQPLFSIVIPTYNRAHIISNAINSVLRQQFTAWELIIIDDGSKDDTALVVQSFKDVRIKYVYQENTERSQARNNGIKLSTGNYICFLDSDDEYCDNHLLELFKFIDENNSPLGIIFTNPIVIEDNQEKEVKVEIYKGGNSLSYILTNSIIPDRVCIHKNIFKFYQFDRNINIGEDTILWAQITNKYPLYHLNRYTVKYHIHDDNSVNLKNNVYLDRLKGLRKLFKEKEVKARLTNTLKFNIISVCYYGIARHYQLKRNFFRMAFNVILSIIYDLKSPQTKAKIYMIYSYLKS